MPEDGSLNPLSKVRRIDSICDRFEAAWNAGTRPVIEAFLNDTPATEQAAVLRELVILDLHYRRHAGEILQPADYLTRFPTLDRDWLVRQIATAMGEAGAGADSDLRTYPCRYASARRSTSPHPLLGRL